jgi:hypothetical protein
MLLDIPGLCMCRARATGRSKLHEDRGVTLQNELYRERTANASPLIVGGLYSIFELSRKGLTAALKQLSLRRS